MAILFKLLGTLAKKNLPVFSNLSRTLGINPRDMFLRLSKAPEQLAQDFLKLKPSVLAGIERDIAKIFSGNIKGTGNFLDSLTKEERKTGSQFVDLVVSKDPDFQKLSSTWLSSGEFRPGGVGNTGELLIKIKGNSKTFAYPGVPRIVWEKMKDAKGGTGAGKTFWFYYLRSYNNTFAARQLRTLRKATGRRKGIRR